MSAQLNPQYEAIGQAFVQQYYKVFDDSNQRPHLVNFYNAETSLMSFEGVQIQGSAKIAEKLASLSFQKVQHAVTTVDSQPMFDGGILTSVIGQLKTDDDPPLSFTQIFVLKPIGDSFYLQHDIFRFALHI
ncbi:probable nuclear transport factor 2 [Artemia franciscana]|uniref:NTF2-related export protein n=1 Tax=Artemia franciscana TaxID=6661 RepID=A0AA88LEK0_ARTSF|nr:hypothetical protein QYM36_002048 [Artemia franciscana]